MRGDWLIRGGGGDHWHRALGNRLIESSEVFGPS